MLNHASMPTRRDNHLRDPLQVRPKCVSRIPVFGSGTDAWEEISVGMKRQGCLGEIFPPYWQQSGNKMPIFKTINCQNDEVHYAINPEIRQTAEIGTCFVLTSSLSPVQNFGGMRALHISKKVTNSSAQQSQARHTPKSNQPPMVKSNCTDFSYGECGFVSRTCKPEDATVPLNISVPVESRTQTSGLWSKQRSSSTS
ncbi:hypothetical protein ACOME3_009466 [Neoechinorhynchus agilis]